MLDFAEASSPDTVNDLASRNALPWDVSGTESKKTIVRFLDLQRLIGFENADTSLCRISFRCFWTETN